MPKAIDCAGVQYGRLTALRFVELTSEGARKWECVCTCGTTCIVRAAELTTGRTQSCGCLQRERAKAAGKKNVKHGMCYSPTHNSWSAMLQRCYNEKVIGYPNYGGRGVEVCDDWKDFNSFLRDMGERPSKAYSLDRIDNNGNYEPSNCRWATSKEQCNNRRSQSYVTFNGRKQTVAQWAVELGMQDATLRHRLYRGWSIQQALTQKVEERNG